MVIFSSHLLLEFTLLLGSVRILSYLTAFSFSFAEALIAFNPTPPRRVSNVRTYLLRLVHRVLLDGTVETSCTSEHIFASEVAGPELRISYLPVMVGRLMLSLKKAAASREGVWSFGEATPTAGLRFADRRRIDAGDEMRLDTLETVVGRSEGAQSRV